MRCTAFFAFLLLLLLNCWQAPLYAQVESDSLIINNEEPENMPDPDSVLADTTAILEYPEKTYVTADEIDTVEVPNTEKEYSPRKASLYSAILPGLGQAYNKKYWKIPLVYGGLIGFGVVVDFYDGEYSKFRRMLLQETAEQGATPYSVRVLENAVEKTRRERDYFIIITGLFYLINIVDAHIDAHLKAFDVSDDLTLRLEPSINSTAFNSQVGGLSLVLYIK